jgi:hypothetical protein
LYFNYFQHYKGTPIRTCALGSDKKSAAPRFLHVMSRNSAARLLRRVALIA